MNEPMRTKQALSQKRPKLGGDACVLASEGGRRTTLLTQGGKREIEIPRKASTLFCKVAFMPKSLCGIILNGFDSTATADRSSQHYTYYDTAEYDALWSRVESLDLPVYVHPRVDSTADLFYRHHNMSIMAGSPWGFHVSTAEMVIALIVNRVCERHPKLKFIIGHLGEIVLFQAWRIDHRL